MLASGAPATLSTNGDPGTCCPAYLIVKACLPGSCGFTFSVNVASPWSYNSQYATFLGPAQWAVSSPGPALLVSIQERISLPTTPCLKPSPEHKTYKK